MVDEFDSIVSNINNEYQSLLLKKETEKTDLIAKAHVNAKKLIEEAEVKAREEGVRLLDKMGSEVQKELEKLEVDFTSKKKKIRKPGKEVQSSLRKEFLKRLEDLE